jgi:dTDP-4-dehydrorhamnose reductase
VRVLVTGAGGMLATALVPALQAAGHETLALARADADVAQPGAIAAPAASFAPDWIAHLAAFTKVDDCESKPDHAHLVNGAGARHAAQAAAACGAAVLAISTDYVFDGRGTAPYREYDPVGPRSVYGASKWAGEQAVREIHDRHLIVRTAWLYGAGGPNFVDTIVNKARAGGPLAVVDDQRGSPTWTRDLAAALITLMSRNERGTVHVTNAGECTWHDLAVYAIRRAGLDVEVARTTTAAFARPAPRPAYSVLGTQLYQQLAGSPLPHWQDAVDRYLASCTT